jgi:hypothetical protein
MKSATMGLVIVLCTACVHRTYETVEVAQQPVEQEALQSARNLPQTFTVVTAARVAGDCPPALSDPSLGTALTLQRSVLLPVADSTRGGFRSFGDYVVTPRGRYGETAGQGLRIDCQRLRALGVITLR